MSEQQRRLYRSQTNKVIAGICGGLSEYLNIDVTIIRLLWVLLTFLGGSGILIYILAFFIIPEKPVDAQTISSSTKSDFALARIFGIIFIAVGFIILLDNLGILSFHRWWHMTSDFVLPSLLIIIGIFFITKRKSIIKVKTEQTQQTETNQQSEGKDTASQAPIDDKGNSKIFHRSLSDKKIFGICGGAGEYFDIDPTIIRIGYVLFTIISGGMGLILYFILYLIIPEGKIESKNPL